jgi:hypothetical protein
MRPSHHFLRKRKLGPDGFHTHSKFRTILLGILVETKFLNSHKLFNILIGRLLDELNKTKIILIPKLIFLITIIDHLRILLFTDLRKYFGKPLLTSQKNREIMTSLSIKSSKYWKDGKPNTFLVSMAGHLTLIKSVMLAIPMYAMQTIHFFLN